MGKMLLTFTLVILSFFHCNSTFNIENLGSGEDTTNKNLNDPNTPVVSGADLTLLDVSYPNRISAEESFSISFNVKNNGDNDLNSGFYVDFYLVSNDAGLQTEYYIEQLINNTNNLSAKTTFSPGTPSSHSITISRSMMASIGLVNRYYQVKLKITPSSLQEEPSENQANNSFIAKDSLQIMNKADLVISSISETTGGSIYTNSYYAIVNNYGPGDLRDIGVVDFKVKFFLTASSDPTSALVSDTGYVYRSFNGILKIFDNVTLDPITLQDFGFNAGNFLTENVYLQAIVNFDDKQPETDKTNNVLLSPIFIN